MNTASSDPSAPETTQDARSMVAAEKNPIDSFLRIWRLMERVAMSLSIGLVAGTVGYISLHNVI